ncbi:hypothetical protein L829_4970 [Mycobacteroides abscessus MAB_030201_1075]|uniref:Uncharacterized protein n=1 Tax=Mycobacteroides abscessus MAB_030201_1075 TaxID=1335410 RepID=A0A829PKY3_9MYCO|nr:hypothetical protein L829_4970 [Mycobacteroides abscessus MAB_030201_1075]
MLRCAMVAIPLAVLIVLVLEALVFGPTGFPTHAVLVAAGRRRATVVFGRGRFGADSTGHWVRCAAEGIDITHALCRCRVCSPPRLRRCRWRS